MSIENMTDKELAVYKPKLTAEPDFVQFWDETKEASARRPLRAKVEKADYPYKCCSVYRFEFEGADGSPVRGWYLLPTEASAAQPVPALIRYHGYTGTDYFFPHRMMYWCAMGMAVLSIDIRGQVGETPDPGIYPNGYIDGWVTRGLPDRDSYYYKQVYMDAVRVIDFACERPEIDVTKIVVHGESQGGGLALVAGALDHRPKLVMSIFPFLSHWRRSVELAVGAPYRDIIDWFGKFDPEYTKEEEVYRTLSYYDVMNMAPLIKARTFMGITMQDSCCPPSSSFAAYHHLNAPKELKVYPNYGHEGSIPEIQENMLRFLDRHLG